MMKTPGKETACLYREAGGERLFAVEAKSGRKIAVAAHEPSRRSPVAKELPVILIPGWSGDRAGPAELLKRLAFMIAESGRPALRFDFLSRGDSDSHPDGNPDIDAMIENTVRIAEFTAEMYSSDGVHMVGICSGGNVGLACAALRKELVKSVTGLSVLPFQENSTKAVSAARRKKHFWAVARRLFMLKTWKKIFSGEVDFRRVIRGFTGKEDKASGTETSGGNPKRASFDVLEKLQGWTGGCKLIYGEWDMEGNAARDIFSSIWPNCLQPIEFTMVAGTDHNFYSIKAGKELAEAILSFINL